MSGYAVIDIETTGLAPERGHRMLELAVVLLDANGRFERAWETLLNPERDLGPQHVTGIRSADAARAPHFDQVAAEVVALLRGRTLVAHNSRLAARFLCAEFLRAGLVVPISETGALCTMRLAELALPGAGRSLADACAAFDIDLVGDHEALAGAVAAAELLGAFLQLEPGSSFWRRWSDYSTALEWPQIASAPREAELPVTTGGHRAVPAPVPGDLVELPEQSARVVRNRAQRSERPLLERITAQLPAIEPSLADSRAERDYFAVLDHALAHGFCSEASGEELLHIARELGINMGERCALHRHYFRTFATAIQAEGLLTADEAAQVRAVGRMLDVPERDVDDLLVPATITGPMAVITAAAIDALLADRTSTVVPQLGAGVHVALSGRFLQTQDAVEAALREHGCVVEHAMSAHVHLLITAESDTHSGKARKARDLGVPIVDEAWLIGELERLQPRPPVQPVASVAQPVRVSQPLSVSQPVSQPLPVSQPASVPSVPLPDPAVLAAVAAANSAAAASALETEPTTDEQAIFNPFAGLRPVIA